jgi:anaerobic ribonucleoside-triphosphate reductase activating protein
MRDPAVHELLACTDLLVDGPYLREQPEPRRRWVGSANQQVHFLTDRYRSDDPCWQRPNTLEIRLRGHEVTINGFPAADAVSLWKRGSR